MRRGCAHGAYACQVHGLLAGGSCEILAKHPPGARCAQAVGISDSARLEARFRERLVDSSNDEQLTLQTQIVRTHSLRSRFGEAHALPDQIEPCMTHAGPKPRVRYLLERGRSLRSSNQKERALSLFMQAADRAGAARLDELTVEAMHMEALVVPHADAQLEWNRRALALAMPSKEPNARNWDASFANHIGMTHHEQGNYAQALASFQTALAARERMGHPARTREAQWMIAWNLRFTKRHDETVLILRRLEAQTAAAPTGFGFEELGEDLLALGRPAEAQPLFATAWERLSRDESPERPDAARLGRLRQPAQP